MPDPSVFDVDTTIANLSRHKWPGIFHIPTQIIKACEKQKNLETLRGIFGPRRNEVNGSGENNIIVY